MEKSKYCGHSYRGRYDHVTSQESKVMEIPEIRNTFSRMFVLLIKSRRLRQRGLVFYSIKTSSIYWCKYENATVTLSEI